jgi:transcriptional regulator with XRE-family HTH domain
VGPAALALWELGHRPPCLESIPRIVAYLGFDPFEPPQTLGQRLRHTRLHLGLSRDKMAARIGVGVKTYERWEDGRIELARVAIRRRLENFLNSICAHKMQ